MVNVLNVKYTQRIWAIYLENPYRPRRLGPFGKYFSLFWLILELIVIVSLSIDDCTLEMI